MYVVIKSHLVIYLFNTFGAPGSRRAHTRYRVKAKIKSSRTPRQSQDIKTPLTVPCSVWIS